MEAQERDLRAAGAEEIHSEQVSSIARRQGLENAISYCRRGDTLIVTKLDRLARSVTHMWEIVRRLNEKGVALRILDLSIDTGSPTGKLILTVMGGIGEFERRMMLERQREGIAKAKAEGRYKGRKADSSGEGGYGAGAWPSRECPWEPLRQSWVLGRDRCIGS